MNIGPSLRQSVTLGLLLLIVSGCASKQKQQAATQQRIAALRAQEEAMIARHQSESPSIFLRGLVQRTMVPWRDDLTLADALLEAGYASRMDPTIIRVTRDGQVYNVNVRELLRGQDNPVLEPGDLVEVYR